MTDKVQCVPGGHKISIGKPYWCNHCGHYVSYQTQRPYADWRGGQQKNLELHPLVTCLGLVSQDHGFLGEQQFPPEITIKVGIAPVA